MTSNLAQHFRDYQRATHAALTLEDRNLSPQGLNNARRGGRIKAHVTLKAQIPTVPEISGPTRPEILDGIRPTTADALALAAREWQKVQALRDAGRRLEEIISTATPARLGAVLDNLEIMPEVLASNDGQVIIGEFEGLVFDRLAALDHPPAVQRIQAEERIAVPAAWNRLLTEALDGPISIAAQTALYRADVEGYREVAAAEIDGLGDQIARFDREQARADLVDGQPDAA